VLIVSPGANSSMWKEKGGTGIMQKSSPSLFNGSGGKEGRGEESALLPKGESIIPTSSGKKDLGL